MRRIHIILALHKANIISNFIENKGVVILHNVARISARISHIIPIGIVKIVIIINIFYRFLYVDLIASIVCVVDTVEPGMLMFVTPEINLTDHLSITCEGIYVFFISGEHETIGSF